MRRRPSRLVAFIAKELNCSWEEVCDMVLDHRERAQLSTRAAVREILEWVRICKEMEAVVTAE